MAEYTNAQVALIAAVDFHTTTSNTSPGTVVRTANQYLEWLNNNDF